MSKDLNAIQEASKNVFLDCVTNHKIKDVQDLRLLAYTVNSADTLFDNHGIPRQIVVDDYTGSLEVDAFAPDFGRKQQVHVLGLQEIVDRTFPIIYRYKSVNRVGGDASFPQFPGQIL